MANVKSQQNPTRGDDVNVPIGGMVLDNTPLHQPENSTRFVLNAVRQTESDDSNTLVSEPGNILESALTTNYYPIGSILLDDDSVVLFSTNGTNGEIGIHENGTYTVLVNSTCLNFDERYPIKGEFRIRNGCERYIYWIDGENPDRSMNIDDVTFYAPGGTLDCERISMLPIYDRPSFALDAVNNSGGNLKLGQYSFCFSLVDKDFNRTEWFGHTRPIPIVDETYGSDYDNVDGGYNITEYTDDQGGVPYSSKSIEFTLSNLDTSYSFVDIGVIIYSTGDGVSTEAYEVDRVSFSTTSMSYTFSEVGDSAVSTTVNSLTQRFAKWKTSRALTQFDGRLIKGNLTEPVRDWSVFQAAASAITSEYVTIESLADDLTVLTAKNPETYLSELDFMRDEVYDIGIVWEFTDGSESPVFHIPGREKNKDHDGNTISDTSDPHNGPTYSNGGIHYRTPPVVSEGWDSTIVDSALTNFENDTWHLDAGVGSIEHERWEIYNTAIRTAQNSGGYYSRGEMAYFESTLEYPDIDDCNGDPVFPTGNIRFHKMPDASLEPHYKGVTATSSDTAQQAEWNLGDDDPRIFHLHVLLDGIVSPAAYSSEIAGYRIVARRLNTIKTKGYWVQPSVTAATATDTDSGTWGVTNPLYVQFYSNEQYFDKKGFGSTYFHFEREYWANKANNASSYAFLDLGTSRCVEGPGKSGAARSSMNYTPLDYSYVDAGGTTTINTYTPSVVTLDNTDGNEMLIWTPASAENRFNLGATLNSGDVTVYGAIKTTNRTFGFNEQPYFAVSTNLSTGTSVEVAGDVVINAMHLEMHDGTNNWYIKGYVESEINHEFRHSSKTVNESKYYPRDFANWYDMFTDLPRTKLYNRDFSIKTSSRAYYTLPFSHNYCDSCLSEFPNSIAYSEVSSVDETVDGYRNFLANSTTTIEGYAGDITNLFAKNRSLYVQTEKSIFQLAPNARELISGEDTIYVGTGNFFEIPPNEIIKTDYGYAGTQGRFNTKATEYGVFWVDQRAGKIYQLGEGINAISDIGLRNWFRENLPSKLRASLRGLVDFPWYDSFTYAGGVGVQLIYDPKYRRIIIHKRDYSPLFTPEIYLGPSQHVEGTIVWVESGNYFSLYTGATETGPLDLENQTYFRNESWTLSYSLLYNSWTSFHSYRPRWMYNDSTTFYTNVGTNSIWKHGDKNFLNFFGDKYKFIMEYVTKDINSRDLRSIQWISYLEQYVNSDREYRAIDDRTFDSVVVYNSDQCTGNLTITPKLRSETYTPQWSNTTTIAERVDNNWRTSRFRDMVTDRSVTVMTSAWDSIKSEFAQNNEQGYIDKVVNSNAIDITKSQYTLENLRDKYAVVRLTFTQPSDYKFTLDLTNTVTKQSVR